MLLAADLDPVAEAAHLDVVLLEPPRRSVRPHGQPHAQPAHAVDGAHLGDREHHRPAVPRAEGLQLRDLARGGARGFAHDHGHDEPRRVGRLARRGLGHDRCVALAIRRALRRGGADRGRRGWRLGGDGRRSTGRLTGGCAERERQAQREQDRPRRSARRALVVAGRRGHLPHDRPFAPRVAPRPARRRIPPVATVHRSIRAVAFTAGCRGPLYRAFWSDQPPNATPKRASTTTLRHPESAILWCGPNP